MQKVAGPQVHPWTREEYHRMIEAGLFAGMRVELIEGQVVERGAMLGPQATSLALTAKALERILDEDYFLRWQMPLAAGVHSEPEPDIAVIPGQIRDYTDAHPTSAALLVAISDTTLTYDRTRKASLYARAGIADYWIVNLVQRQLEVYRAPGADPAAAFGFSYDECTVYTGEDRVAPLLRPSAEIAVADLLP